MTSQRSGSTSIAMVVLPGWMRAAGFAVMSLLVVAAWVQLATQGSLGAWSIGGGVVALGLFVAVDRLASAAVAALPAMVMSGAAVALSAGRPSSVGFFVLALVTALLALRVPLWAGLAGWMVAMGTFVVLALARPDAGWPNWAAGVSIAFWGCWAARYRIGLTERLHRAEAAAAAATAAAQRQQLAAELHDIVGHTLAVTLLHLGGARLAVSHAPAEAKAGISEAERLARRSMTDLRTLVQVLAADPEPMSGAGEGRISSPQPTASEVPVLLAEYRAAGLAVTEHLSGTLSAASPAVGLVLYGVVREGLANATRHAPGQPVDVLVCVDADGAVAATLSNPCPRVRPEHGEGMGLAAMRERVGALGGRLEAGPDGDRWTVRAELPC